MANVAIAHDRRDRAESLGVMHPLGAVRVGAVVEHWRQEGASLRIGALDREAFRIAKDPLGFGADHRGLLQNVALLAAGDQRAHAGGLERRIADGGLREPRRNRLDQRRNLGLGRDDPADRGAFLSRLGGHLAMHFLDEEIEFRRARGCIGAEDRGVEAVLLGHEADRVLDDMGRGAQRSRCGCGAGEAHHVLAGEPVEHVAQAPGDKLQRAFRQQPALQHDPHAGLGHVAGRRGRLHDGRDTGKQRRREFFQHPPDREVEGVDMHRDALQRRADMLAEKGPGAGELFDLAIEIDMAIWQFAPPLGGEDKDRADAAIDIDQVIFLGRPGGKGDVVERLLVLAEFQRQRLEHPRAVVEGHRPQGRAALGADEIEHCGDVERVIPGLGHRSAGHGRADEAGPCAGRDPGAGGEAFDLLKGHDWSSGSGPNGLTGKNGVPLAWDKGVSPPCQRRPVPRVGASSPPVQTIEVTERVTINCSEQPLLRPPTGRRWHGFRCTNWLAVSILNAPSRPSGWAAAEQ